MTPPNYSEGLPPPPPAPSPAIAVRKGKSSTGLDENVAAALSYLLGWLTGILFFVIEKESQFVKFHAMQSTVLFLCMTILNFVLGFIPFIGWMLAGLISLVGLILWLVSMYRAYRGEKFKWPIVGEFAEKKV